MSRDFFLFCHTLFIELINCSGAPGVEIDLLYIIQVHSTPSAVRIQYVYAVQKQQRERINVTRKHIKLMRERESVRTHAHLFCSVTKPDALAQIHAALTRRECAHLKRVFSRSNCVLCTHNSLCSCARY